MVTGKVPTCYIDKRKSLVTKFFRMNVISTELSYIVMDIVIILPKKLKR